MPLSQDSLEAILAWARGDGCAIGGIYGEDGDLSSQLATALCESHSLPNILYVRTTALEASLLEQELAQALPDAGEHIRVWSGEDEVPEVALTTYSDLHTYLRKHAGQEHPIFADSTLVVLEHEIGVWVEGLITRDMLAFVAGELAEDPDGPWLKILGLSYTSRPQEWLQHPVQLMGGPNGRLTLELVVCAEDQVSIGNVEKAVWDKNGIEACAIEIARTLKMNLNVVVFSTRARFGTLRDAVVDLRAGEFMASGDLFSEWPHVSLSREVLPLFTREETIGQMIGMPHDGFPCALPFERIGMTVIMAPGKKPVYNKKARLCLRSNVSLTQPQYWIESTLKSPGQAPPPVVCFVGHTDSLPRCATHLVNREDDYLAGWLSVISSYPSRPIEELPFFRALSDPACSRDCLTQLQVMGLVEAGRDRIGFTLTEKGSRVIWAYQYLANISLSGISALSDVSVCLANNTARSAVRLILLLEHYPTTVKAIARHGDAVSGEDFGLMLQEFASVNGGPGRKHVDRGSLWAAWVALEDAASGLRVSLGDFEDVFAGPELAPKMKKPLFVLRTTGVCGFSEDVVIWEQKLGLDPLHENDWADFELADSDADTIQDIMAKSYYPYLLEIPVELKARDILDDTMSDCLYRSKSMVRGSSPLYNFYKEMWTGWAREQAPTKSTDIYAGLSTPAVVLEDLGNEIIANPLMVIPYRAPFAVDKDGADKWARKNSRV